LHAPVRPDPSLASYRLATALSRGRMSGRLLRLDRNLLYGSAILKFEYIRRREPRWRKLRLFIFDLVLRRRNIPKGFAPSRRACPRESPRKLGTAAGEVAAWVRSPLFRGQALRCSLPFMGRASHPGAGNLSRRRERRTTNPRVWRLEMLSRPLSTRCKRDSRQDKWQRLLLRSAVLNRLLRS
jgi:hypothetical protein